MSAISSYYAQGVFVMFKFSKYPFDSPFLEKLIDDNLSNSNLRISKYLKLEF